MSWVKTNVEEMGITSVTGCLFFSYRELFSGRGGGPPKKEVLPALCWSQVKICTLEHQNLLSLGTSERCKYRQDKWTEIF